MEFSLKMSNKESEISLLKRIDFQKCALSIRHYILKLQAINI